MSMKNQVAVLAARGLTGAEISRELGVTEGYISQLGSDDEYLRKLAELQSHQATTAHSVHAKIDNCYDELELSLVETLVSNKDALTMAIASKPALTATMIKVLNGAKRRGSGEGNTSQTDGLAVIQLPSFIIQQATSLPTAQHNSDNEVIEVDGRALVSLGDKALRGQLEELQATRPELGVDSPEPKSDILANWDNQDPTEITELDLHGL